MSKSLTIQDVQQGKLEEIKELDKFNYIVNRQPPKAWVKQHYQGFPYIPADKIELLLRKMFRDYKIEVLREKSMFNGVVVTARIHYKHPVLGEWYYHDGVGAGELQTESGAAAADMNKVNSGALEKAVGKAKTAAVKNAAKNFGKLFGADLGRDDTLEYTLDQPPASDDEFKNKIKPAVESGDMTADKACELYDLTGEQEQELQNIGE